MKATISVSSPGHEVPTVDGKTVVLCLGNRYMGDDGVGIIVAEELMQRRLGPHALVDPVQTLDLTLLSQYGGAARIIIVDALESGLPPGTVSKYRIAPRGRPLESIPGLHGLQLHDLLDIANGTGVLTCPVIVVGVEPEECHVGEGLSAELRSALPDVLDLVLGELGS